MISPQRTSVSNSSPQGMSASGMEGGSSSSENTSSMSASSRTIHSEDFISNLIHSVPARAALGTLLQIVHNNPTFIDQGWTAIWHSLGVLRDCALLPMQMIIETDVDLLPPMVRREFEARLAAIASAIASAKSNEGASRVTTVKKTPSLLSFQGLGEAFFGTNDASNVNDLILNQIKPFNSRWDAGYGDMSSSSDSARHDNSFDESEANPDNLILRDVFCTSNDNNSGKHNTEDNGDNLLENDAAAIAIAVGNLRELVSACQISHLVSDTRFLTESTLIFFLEALVKTSEARELLASETLKSTREKTVGGARGTSLSHDFIDISNGRSAAERLKELVRSLSVDLPPPSESSSAWLEMLLVEAALRNRDRFAILWSLLDSHYRRTLGAADVLSYCVER